MWCNQKFAPALVTLLPAQIFPNKLPPTVPNNRPRNPVFCYFAPFLIVLSTAFINKPEPILETYLFSCCIWFLHFILLMSRTLDLTIRLTFKKFLFNTYICCWYRYWKFRKFTWLYNFWNSLSVAEWFAKILPRF